MWLTGALTGWPGGLQKRPGPHHPRLRRRAGEWAGPLSWARPLRPVPAGYRGGNCELGAGGARLAVGAVAVYPMTAQLMSTPAEP
jgi:hypothetical protein